jgi:murein DD-endopeptidase MepM/ murein hydrolase activator NlpD
LDRGATLASILTKFGFTKSDIYQATRVLSRSVDLKSLKPGQEIIIFGTQDKTGAMVLNGLELAHGYRYRLVVARTKSGYKLEKVEVPLKKVVRTISGKLIPGAPTKSLQKCGLKPVISNDTLKCLLHVVDLPSVKKPLDFEVLYRDFYDDRGNCVGRPEVLYVSALIDGRIKRVYSYKVGDKNEYVDSTGAVLMHLSQKRSQLLPPLTSMHITSRYGIRRHPISGRYRKHTGVDLSARVGTPVRAASSGTVQQANIWAGYGRYIRIKHTPRISTAYGHLSRIVVRSGQRVSQGQIIGYTGVSGTASGPHLHYEVLKDGTQINPLTTIKQEPYSLSGQDLRRFNNFKREINLQLVGLHTNKNKHGHKA